MPQELFDIVNENNQPLGVSKPRSEVHNNLADWHRATHVWILNSNNQILCQQRSLMKDVNPGKWQSFFGGHLKKGETYEESAIKELKEELGISVDSSKLIPLYIRKSKAAKHFSQVYVLVLDKDISEFTFDNKEIAQLTWLSIDELKEAIEQGEFCNSLDEKVIEWLRREEI